MTLNSAKKAGGASGDSKGSSFVSNGAQADGRRRRGGRTHIDAAKSISPQVHDRLRANNKPSSVTKEDIAQERMALLGDRQVELDQVLDKHDDLIRERFHLEHFVTLLGYDPIAAKRDDSVVFQEYKAKYDLVEQVAAVAGPSRTTRRAHTRRIMNITAQPDSLTPKEDPASHIFPPSASTGMLSTKAKGKHKMIDTSESVSHAPILGAQTSERGRYLNGKAIATSTAHSRTSKHGVVSVPAAPEPLPDASMASTEELLVMPIRSKKRTSFSMTSLTSSPVPLKRRKSTLDGESSSPYPRRTGRLEGAQTPKLAHASSASTSRLTTDHMTTSSDPPKVTASPSIKRVRLIVRRPPPSYSNPKQRPAPPRFQSSLESFLRSYTTMDDQDQTEDNLQKMALQEAILRNKIDRLQRLGRFFPYTESSSVIVKGGASDSGGSHVGGSSGSSNKVSLLPLEPQRPEDVWDHIIEAVAQRSRNGLVKGQQVSAHVASRIQAYWDQYASRERTAKVQEEKRLRALAKATIKMVTSEWKKAVFYIREQERLREEAEEKRRGHEHLDAILDQSGQILETQHFALAKGEMSRSQSRSSSISMDYPWVSSDEGGSLGDERSGDEFGEIEMEHDTIEDGDDVEGMEESGSEGSEDGDESTRALLGLELPEDLETANTGEHSVAERLDADSADQESVKSALASLEFDAEDGVGTDPHSAEGTEWVEASHVPSEVNSATQTPTDRDSYSPVLDGPHDYPTPASSAMALDTPLDAKVDIGPPSMHISRQTSPTPPSSASSSHGVSAHARATTDDNADAGVTPLFPEDHHDGIPTSVQSASGEGSPIPEPPRDEDMDDAVTEDAAIIPGYLKPFAVAPVEWSPETKIKPPLLLRGVLRPYQQSGLEWLASLHLNNLNGILADEMGLGKTIQTISLLAHLACDRGIWGPHLIIVPTSVLLNWEMEFKKFLPGFKILSYHGNTKRRKELRQGWYNKYQFNVCITSYALASRDAHIFKRKMWYYMVLDEAHMIKNFKSQRWNILLMFRSFRRLLLTGTPLQNNLTELWALLQFLMSGTDFANLKEFGEWFSNPLEKAIEMGTALDDENLLRVSKLHTVLRPYLLRRLKRDVEKELPSKYEHLVLCPLSKRQRFLYDEFMSRAQTREALHSGVYQKIANILMQLRKVCNHPDLFEVRPVVTSFAMPRSAVADYEIKELLVRRRLLLGHDEEKVNLDLFGFRFIHQQDTPLISALETCRLNTPSRLPLTLEDPPQKDTRTIQGYRAYRAYVQQTQTAAHWAQIIYINDLRCSRTPIYGHEMLRTVRQCYRSILPLSFLDLKTFYMDTPTTPSAMVTSYEQRAQDLSSIIGRFAFVTPAAVALDIPRFALLGCQDVVASCSPGFDRVLHLASVKLQIAFPDPSLLQYDCGKLQELSRLLRQRKAEGHRVLIFTQMTRVLDILEIFLNFHGYLYLRLDGATKIEDRQYITERFNADARIFCFISSSRSGGVGINLTGADTVIFYDSDFNPQMDRQCEDRAHRIGQIRDVHIYRFISSHTVEEAMLMKANQKRSLDEIVIQKGEFDWRTIFEDDGALTKALGEFEDTEDAHAAAVAAREEDVLEGANQADFGAEGEVEPTDAPEIQRDGEHEPPEQVEIEGDHGEDGGTISDYMITYVRSDYEFFRDWRL
ncbi:SNF2 family N-terminal domain-containing protein [Scleroderma yunnanense]